MCKEQSDLKVLTKNLTSHKIIFSIIGNPQIHRKFKDSIADTQK